MLVPLWNVTCKKAWDTARPGLIADYAKNHTPYVRALAAAVAEAEKALSDLVGPAKLEISATLDKQPGLMLTDRVRKVFSERLNKIKLRRDRSRAGVRVCSRCLLPDAEEA